METLENEKIYILKKINNEYLKEKLNVPNLLFEKLDVFKNQFIKDKDDFIFFHNTLRNIFLPYQNKSFTYCRDLSDSFVNLEISLFDFYVKINTFFSIEIKKDKTEFSYNSLKVKALEYLESRKNIINYYLFFSKLRETKNVLIISNKIGGWSNPKYQIPEDFSLEVKSNFGYGRASYFYVTIKYKNVNITPFSDWLYYRFCKFFEINGYTKKYHSIGDLNKKIIFYSSWNEVVDFAYKTIKLIEDDLDTFIQNYIIDELRLMIEGLINISKYDNFDFYDIYSKNNLNEIPAFKRVNLRGEELLEFRTEKILGAIDFIEDITKINDLINLQSYIIEIEKISKMFFPVALQEFERITLIYLDKKEEYDILKPLYENQITLFYEEINRIESIMKELNDEEILKDYQFQIINLKNDIRIVSKKSMLLHNNFNRLRIAYEKFDHYISKYNAYFDKV
ncbi:hypothetical protein [Chryseobacterium sp. FH1]|uniref:hypothetical protein n=1 Tax=Chryseobacterium sp. FH1 TaxID=1233951 RepID=UPI0004E2C22F|nr:hypothetical protein [Chryseobacterium sp. FH1]KFC24563.1 hypothetical protein IO90_00135 [Chryseobacterium sp. FH1]